MSKLIEFLLDPVAWVTREDAWGIPTAYSRVHLTDRCGYRRVTLCGRPIPELAGGADLPTDPQPCKACERLAKKLPENFRNSG